VNFEMGGVTDAGAWRM